jgi:hypothetical protein
MNEETNQALEKFADKIIQKVTQDFSEKLEVVQVQLTEKITQDFTEKLEVVRLDITEKITQDFSEKLEVVRSELTKKIEESNEKLNQKMDTGFEMMHTQINTVEENITMRVQGLENRMDNEANFRLDNYVKKEEYKKLDERVGSIEIKLKLA